MLNSDGQRHPLLNALAAFFTLIGLVSFALGLLLRTGPSVDGERRGHGQRPRGLGRRAVVQMISATREQRILIVTGIIAGFVGLAIALARAVSSP